MVSMQLHRLKSLRLTVSEDIRLQENAFFDLALVVKVTGNVALYPLHHVTYAAVNF